MAKRRNEDMKQSKITDREYDKLIKRLEFFDTMRNNLLTFSFTAVLTVLGVAMTMNMDTVSTWICLIPFLLIIPFTARISYYRLASAHIGSFLRKYSKTDMKFELGAMVVSESKCKRYNLIAWLINHEMVLLGIATSITFYFKYIVSVNSWTIWNYISLIVPTIFIVIVYVISDSTYNYNKLLRDFGVEWDKYIKSDFIESTSYDGTKG